MSQTKPPQFPSDRIERRDAIAKEVARYLLEYLLSGDARDGVKFPSERELAEGYGVSRSAIREAIQSLNMLGLVEIRPGDGTYARVGDSELLPRVIEWGLLLRKPTTKDLTDARSHIEVGMARMAAERATEEEVAQLRLHLDAMRDSSNSADFVEADIAFHLTVSEIAGNTVLLDFLTSIRSLLRVWMSRVTEQAGETERAYREHLVIWEAIAASDPGAAAEAMLKHMNSASDRLLRIFGVVEASERVTSRASPADQRRPASRA